MHTAVYTMLQRGESERHHAHQAAQGHSDPIGRACAGMLLESYDKIRQLMDYTMQLVAEADAKARLNAQYEERMRALEAILGSCLQELVAEKCDATIARCDAQQLQQMLSETRQHLAAAQADNRRLREALPPMAHTAAVAATTAAMPM